MTLQLHVTSLGMKISTTKTEVLYFSRNPDQYLLQVSELSLKQVKFVKIINMA